MTPPAATTDELLAALLATSQEQLRWQRAAVLPEVRKTIDQTLNNAKLRKAYELLDGTHTGTEVAKAVGSAQQTVSVWVGRWRDLGIAYDYVDEQGHKRTKHLVSLEDLGLPLEIDGQ